MSTCTCIVYSFRLCVFRSELVVREQALTRFRSVAPSPVQTGGSTLIETYLNKNSMQPDLIILHDFTEFPRRPNTAIIVARSLKIVHHFAVRGQTGIAYTLMCDSRGITSVRFLTHLNGPSPRTKRIVV